MLSPRTIRPQKFSISVSVPYDECQGGVSVWRGRSEHPQPQEVHAGTQPDREAGRQHQRVDKPAEGAEVMAGQQVADRVDVWHTGD